MRRSLLVVPLAVAVLVAGTHPAEAATVVSSGFVRSSIVETYSGNNVINIAGRIRSTNVDCRFGRTIEAGYKDLSHNWRIAGFTNASDTNGNWSFSTSGETKSTPAYLLLFKKKIGPQKFCSGAYISRGPE